MKILSSFLMLFKSKIWFIFCLNMLIMDVYSSTFIPKKEFRSLLLYVSYLKRLWQPNTFTTEILFTGISNLKIFYWMRILMWSFAILAGRVFWRNKNKETVFVGLMNICLPKLFMLKHIPKKLMFGVWEFFYMKCFMASLHLMPIILMR